MTDRKGCMSSDATICMYLKGPTVSRLADYAEETGQPIQDAARTLFLRALDQWVSKIDIQICASEGCGVPVYTRDLCRNCYRRAMRAGTISILPSRKKSNLPVLCSVEGCEKLRQRGKGKLCSMHYSRWRRTGDVGGAEPVQRRRYMGVACEVEGCEMEAAKRGKCSKHYDEAARRARGVKAREEKPAPVPREGALGARTPDGERRARALNPPEDRRRAVRETWVQKESRTPQIVLDLPAPTVAALDLSPIRWPKEETEESCTSAIRAALSRCSNDTRAARQMLGVDLQTWDRWFHRARSSA